MCSAMQTSSSLKWEAVPRCLLVEVATFLDPRQMPLICRTCHDWRSALDASNQWLWRRCYETLFGAPDASATVRRFACFKDKLLAAALIGHNWRNKKYRLYYLPLLQSCRQWMVPLGNNLVLGCPHNCIFTYPLSLNHDGNNALPEPSGAFRCVRGHVSIYTEGDYVLAIDNHSGMSTVYQLPHLGAVSHTKLDLKGRLCNLRVLHGSEPVFFGPPATDLSRMQVYGLDGKLKAEVHLDHRVDTNREFVVWPKLYSFVDSGADSHNLCCVRIYDLDLQASETPSPPIEKPLLSSMSEVESFFPGLDAVSGTDSMDATWYVVSVSRQMQIAAAVIERGNPPAVREWKEFTDRTMAIYSMQSITTTIADVATGQTICELDLGGLPEALSINRDLVAVEMQSSPGVLEIYNFSDGVERQVLSEKERVSRILSRESGLMDLDVGKRIKM